MITLLLSGYHGDSDSIAQCVYLETLNLGPSSEVTEIIEKELNPGGFGKPGYFWQNKFQLRFTDLNPNLNVTYSQCNICVQ